MSIVSKYRGLIDTLGRSAIHALYPNEFEVYFVALELTDSDGSTIDYFSFPVNPDSIAKNEPHRTNVKKSQSGVTVLSSNSYTPETITISGNFGKSFHVLISTLFSNSSFTSLAYSTKSGIFSALDITKDIKDLRPVFSSYIKTGYGSLKLLQAILNKSNGLDHLGKPFRLYFYNPCLGESHWVKVNPSGPNFNMNKEMNTIWTYNFALTTIAPLDSLKGEIKSSSLVNILSKNAIQKGVNVLANDIRRAAG
jgi:hypothetical protein